MTKLEYDWKYFSFKISILLLVKVPTIQSTCKHEIQFGSPIVCILRCTSNFGYVEGTYTQAQNMAQIEYGYEELSLCYYEGIRLELNNNVSPSFVVRANSFTANINVNDLAYSLVAISEMEAYSLNATAFKWVTRLVFTNTSITTFKNGLFNGLESVEKIHFKDVSDANLTIETGILDVLNRTLTEFTFEQLTRTTNEIVIDGFTGSAVLSKLTTVKYMYNLKNSITNKSFVGLERVNTLDLSNCQIETFGVGAFDAISTSVQTLKLENNFIRTLPAGLFDIMLPSHYTRINLSGNEKWICDCVLLPFRADLREHSSNFIGTVECDSPVEYKGDKVVETNFCEPTTTTEVTTEITTEITTEFTTEFTTPLPPEIPQECFEPGRSDKVTETITIRGPSQTFSIIQNQSVGVGDIVLRIDEPMENGMLIWFALDDNLSTNVSEISCMMTSSSSIRVTNLTVNWRSTSTYTFCLMNSAEKTISPLDCISHSTRDDGGHKQPWINESKKGLVIGVISSVFGLCILAGFASACVSFKLCAKGDLYPVAPNGMMKTQYSSNESAPPLPPRPCSLPTKDYTYATVQ